ncbi:hypothetical protein KUTeg_017184 [Tegillarca granosa]|uniref:F-box domain-containing protein n=1 Tax=Tegillarca granosa TaxID=220873 RepID=A0ABQ9EN60_TEGGR|nr:hypothetical protein KUTeg_017184 [Tegillarca granosa]
MNQGKSKLKRTDEDGTKYLYQEMGVDSLSSDSDSSNSLTELTPSISINSGNHSVPGAPRILLPSQKQNIEDYTTPSPTSSTSYLSLGRNNLTFKRRLCLPELNYFSDLSDEIVLHIFRWLPKFTLAKCARVCQRWKRLVMDESLWKRIDLANRALSPATLFHVLNRGVQILRLTKTEVDSPLIPSPSVLQSHIRLTKVQYLDLSMSSIPIPLLEELFAVCKDLKKISLEHCELSDKVCQLESLNLAWTGLHRHSVVYLSLCLPSNLHKLNISGCRENITDEEILQLCRTCPYLRELDLSDSTVITCTSLNYIMDNLNHLEYLALSRNYRIMPQTIQQLRHMDSLIAVDLFGMFREGALKELRESMPHLEVNKFPFSNIARPTTGIRRTSIWGLRVRDI